MTRDAMMLIVAALTAGSVLAWWAFSLLYAPLTLLGLM